MNSSKVGLLVNIKFMYPEGNCNIFHLNSVYIISYLESRYQYAGVYPSVWETPWTDGEPNTVDYTCQL